MLEIAWLTSTLTEIDKLFYIIGGPSRGIKWWRKDMKISSRFRTTSRVHREYIQTGKNVVDLKKVLLTAITLVDVCLNW